MASLSVVFDLIAKDNASRAIGAVGSAADDAGKKAGGLTKAGVAVGSAIGGLAAGGITAGLGAIKGFATGSVDAFARVEDATGAATVQFGKAVPSVVAFADAAAKNFGISKGAALDAANTFGTMGKAAGLQGPELAGFANQFSGLAGDLASFKGTSTEQAIEAIGSALRGEAEPIRAYGVLLDDASLRQEALSQGLIKTTKEALTPQQKVLASQALILKQTSDAQGDYQRTSDSTANTQKTLAAEIDNAQAKLGEKLAPALTAVRGAFLAVLEGSGRFIDAIGPGMARAKEAVDVFIGALRYGGKGEFDGFLGFINDVGATISEDVLPAMKSAAGAVKGFLESVPVPVLAGVAAAVGAIGIAMGLSAAATAVQTAAAAALNAVLLLNPFVAVAALVIGLGVALVVAYKRSEEFREKVDSAFRVVREAGAGLAKFVTETIPKAFADVRDKVGAAATRTKELVGDTWSAIKNAIPAAWEAIKGALKTAVDAVQAAFKAYVDLYIGVVSAVWTAIRNGVAGAWNLIRDALGVALTAIVTYITTFPARFVSGMQTLWTAVQNAIPAAFGLIRDAIGTAFTGKGGILAKVLGFGKDIVESIIDGIKAKAGAIGDAISGAVGKIKLPSIDLPFGDGPGVGGLPEGAFKGEPPGVRRLMSLLPAGTPLLSGYRPGAITATGNPSYHGKGRAVDLPPSLALFNYIKSRFGNVAKELIFSPAGGRQVHNGQEHLYGGVTRANHFDHVHWAMANGGVIGEPVIGTGLRSGKSYAFGERGPETVTPGVPDNGAMLQALTRLVDLDTELVRLVRDQRDQMEALDRRTRVGG